MIALETCGKLLILSLLQMLPMSFSLEETYFEFRRIFWKLGKALKKLFKKLTPLLSVG